MPKVKNTSKIPVIGKLVFIGAILILLYAVINSAGGDFMLKRNGECIKAILYSETSGGHTKSSLWYRFSINGKNHDGVVVQDGVLKIGDSICVVYLPSFPGINRPANYFDSGEVKCICGK